MKFEKRQKFAIRKFSIGVASVLIGSILFYPSFNGEVLARDVLTFEIPAENEIKPDTSKEYGEKVETTGENGEKITLIGTKPISDRDKLQPNDNSTEKVVSIEDIEKKYVISSDETPLPNSNVEYKSDATIELGKRNEVITETGKKIITIGTKPTTVVEEISPIITYQEDKELEGGTTREEESNDPTHNGKISTITHTYKVNPTTGEITDKPLEAVLTDSGKKGKIIHVGTKKAIHTEPIHKTLYVADETVPGSERYDLVYTMDWYERINEIEYEYDNVSHRAIEKAKKFVKMVHVRRIIGLSEPIREVVDRYPVEIVKVPAGSTVESRDEIMKYHYIPNPKLESGEKIVSKNGKPLIIEERNFYTIDPLNGDQIITKKIIKKQELEYGIIEIGVKPKVVYKDVPIKIQKGNELIDTGEKFTVKATITYTIPTDFETSGKLIENINIEPVSSDIDISKEESVVNSSTNTSDKSLTGNFKDLKTDIVYESDNTLERGKRIEKNDVSGKKIIRIGTKPIVITEDIPPATVYVEDKNLNGGDTYEVISEDKSHNGKKSIVTLTYDLDKETGELIEHQSEPKIEYTEEKGKIIHVGTKRTNLIINEVRPYYLTDKSLRYKYIPPVFYYSANPSADYVTNVNNEKVEIEYSYDDKNHEVTVKSWKRIKTKDSISDDEFYRKFTKTIGRKEVLESHPMIRNKYIPDINLETGVITNSKESKKVIIEKIRYYSDVVKYTDKDSMLGVELPENLANIVYEVKGDNEPDEIKHIKKVKKLLVKIKNKDQIINKELSVEVTFDYTTLNDYSTKVIEDMHMEIEPVVLEEPKVTSDKPTDAPTNEAPEYTGGVNLLEPPILELPSYTYRNTSSEEEDLPRKEDNNYRQSVVYKTNDTENINREKQSTEKRVDDTVKTSMQERINNKSELPNTGTEDNKSLASLGFLGLIFALIPFVKNKH